MSTIASKSTKLHISATSLEMYWRCPEQYRRRYLEDEVIPPGIALLQGGAFHVGVETNFRQKIDTHRDLPASAIVEAAVAAFDAKCNGEYALTEEENSRGPKVVLGEAKDKTAQLARVHATEQAPEYQPTAVEHTTRIILPKASRDLLAVTDLRDDQGRVTDFKTAGRRMPESAVETSTQLTIYAAAFQIDTGKPPVEVRLDVVTKAKQPTRQLLRSNRTKADMQVLVNRINATLDAIEKGSFPPCSTGSWCCTARWCGFWLTCPYVNQERRDAATSANGD